MDDILQNPKLLEQIPSTVLHHLLQRGIYSDTNNFSHESVDESTNKGNKRPSRNRIFRKTAVAGLNRAASLFIIYITTIAHDIAKSQKRSTVLERDVLAALKLSLFWEIEREIGERSALPINENEQNIADINDEHEIPDDKSQDEATDIENINDEEVIDQSDQNAEDGGDIMINEISDDIVVDTK
ncbi:Histone-fold [Babesia duncani]|uniref:Histone-fold n=1 Tax=Babesia duncani TaxID=323732 RepID=A0AAD9UQU6_9APIC|nr:Histone-fold [Babesia duncani]